MEIGFIGLGKMGRAMARNLARAGHQVRAWNRSGNAGGAVEGVGLVAAPGDAFQADVVFTMLSDDAAIRAVLLAPDVLGAARAGVVHVVTSTISVAFADELRAAHAAAGVGYVAAPVFGRPEVAEAAQLNIVAAGAPADVDRVQPLLAVLGRQTWVLGEDPKQATAAKLAGNLMIALAIEAMAEGVVLTGSTGLAPAAFLELMTQTLFGGRSYETYSAKIVRGDYEPGFRLHLGLKDIRLAAAAAETAGRRLPLLDALRTRMTDAVAAGLGDRDWSAIAAFTQQHHG